MKKNKKIFLILIPLLILGGVLLIQRTTFAAVLYYQTDGATQSEAFYPTYHYMLVQKTEFFNLIAGKSFTLKTKWNYNPLPSYSTAFGCQGGLGVLPIEDATYDYETKILTQIVPASWWTAHCTSPAQHIFLMAIYPQSVFGSVSSTYPNGDAVWYDVGWNESGIDAYITDIYFEITGQLPPTISNINQYKSDGVTLIPEGEITTESTVIFKVTLNDPDNDQVKLQIELKEFNQSFNEQDLLESEFVNSGSEAIITKQNLIDGQYHWRARVIDDKGNASEWQEFGQIGNIDFTVDSSLSTKAAILAKELVNYPYLFGGKGWDFDQKEFVSPDNIKSGYRYWNPTLGAVSTGIGLDCSGLIMWAFDRSFDPLKSRFNNFVKAEGADEQYRYNTTSTAELQLKSGDVMFFDNTPKDGFIDHVAMYVGESGGYDVVNAADPVNGIISASSTILKQLPKFVTFKQVVLSSPPAVRIFTHSPIDLTVTNPDGFTITSTTTISSDEEYLREIPGELYYSIYDIEPDGTPQIEVYSPQPKQGNYIIKPVKREDAPTGAVYSITIDSDAGPLVVADNVPVDSIPQNGYGVSVQENSITKVDINPPVTVASTTGTLGVNDWYISDVAVTLTATDTESGVASTDYSFDNGLTWFTYTTAAPIIVNKEGTTTIIYYSTDNSGNKEAVSTLTIKIDKTPPEAKISVDPATKDLLIEGIDNLNSAIVSRDDKGNYIITDESGHTANLIFNKTYTGKLLTYAKLTGIQYDNNPVVNLPNSYFLYVWNLLVKPQTLISQTIYVDNTYTIEAVYDKKSNKTTVFLKQKGVIMKKQEFSGLKIVKLTTSKGIIGYEF